MAIQFLNNPKVGDNVKIEIGASSDLLIYHDASNSYITNATGELFIKAADDLSIQDTDGTNRAIFQANAQKLYYDGSQKFETTSAGIGVTGNITATNNSYQILLIDTSTSNRAEISVEDSAFGFYADRAASTEDSSFFWSIDNSNKMEINLTAGGEGQLRLNDYGPGNITGTAEFILGVDSNGNVIETSAGGSGTVTGTGVATRVAFWSSTSALSSDANLYWDNTNDRLGIGTTAPAAKLDLVGGDVTGGLRISEDKTNSSFFAFGADANETRITSSSYGGFKPLTIHTGGSERMRIDSAGNVGIGVTNIGSAGLSLANSLNFNMSEGVNSSFLNIFRQASSAATVIANGYKYSDTSNAFASSYAASWAKSAVALNYGTIRFFTDSPATTAVGTNVAPTERMRIDAGGDLTVIASYSSGTFPFRVGYGTYASFTPTFVINDSGNVTITGQINATGEANNGGTINIGDTPAYRGVLSYTGAGSTILSIANTYDSATSQINFNLRTAATSVTALSLKGTGDATFAGNVALTNGVLELFNAQPMYFYSTPTVSNYELLSIDKLANGNARLRVYKSGSGSFRGFEIQTGGSASLTIDSSQAIKFNAYTAGTLVSDASGNITAISGGGEGGPYLPLAGGTMTGNTRLNDSVEISFGNSDDMRIYHSGTEANIKNFTGPFIIEQNTNDGDIIFKNDDGNGGLFDYFNVDGGSATYSGGATTAVFTKWPDKSRIALGSGKDLQIYHDGSNSYITNATGGLLIQTDTFRVLNSAGTEQMFRADVDDAVQLYFNNVVKLATTSAGVTVTGAITLSGKISGVTAGTANTDAVNLQQLNQATTGVLIFKGTWDAESNNPTLASGEGTTGEYYIVAVAGTTDLDGIDEWAVGDWAVFSDLDTDSWQKIDNTNILGGAGTGGTITAWTGSGTSTTLGNAPITVSGNNTTFAGNVTVGADLIIPEYIYHTGNLTTFFGFPSDNTFKIKTNNAEALTIDSSQNSTFAGQIIASKNQNATSSFTFQNTDTTGTAVRTHLNATAGNRSIRLESIHNDYSYIVSTNRMYFQTNGGSNNTLLLDGNNATFAGDIIVPNGKISTTGGNNLTLSGSVASHAGLIFATNSVLPAVVSAETNNVVDLGQNGNSFKNLYLGSEIISGGGATFSAAITFEVPSAGGSFINVNHSGNESWTIAAQSGVGADDYLDIGISGGNRAMSWHETGNVGIGTTAPVNKLNVEGDIGYTGVIGQGSIYGNSGNSSYANMKLYDAATGFTTINNQSYGYYFNTAAATKVAILNNGNVGINTTTPQSKLDVRMSNNTTASIGGTISAGSFSGLSFGYAEPGNANYRHSAIVFERDDSGFGDARGKIHLLNSPSGSTSADLGDARLTILPSGNVGIGTTAPGSKLHVVGETRLTGGAFRVSTDSTIVTSSVYTFRDAVGINNVNGSSFASGTATMSIGAMSNGVSLITTGAIGIGTTSPAGKLDVVGSGSGVSIRVAGVNTDSNAYYYGFMHDAVDLQGTTQVNTFYSGGAIKASTTIADYAGIRIDTPSVSAAGAAITNNYGVYQSSSLQKNYFAGNIGIGTTGVYSTDRDLNLSGKGVSIKNNVNGSNNNWSYIYNTATGSSSNLVFATGASLIALTLSHNGSATFTTNTNSGGFVNQVNSNTGSSAYVSKSWINDVGNAEIWRNSSTRSQTGGAVQSFNIYNSQDVNIWSGGTRAVNFDTSQNATFAGNVNLHRAVSPTLSIKDTTNNVDLLLYSQDNDSHIGTYSNHNLTVDTNSTERIRITSAGNVGIGTTNPGHKLDVNGKIYSSGDIQAAGQLTGASLRLPEGGNGSDISEPVGFIDINVDGTVYVIPYYTKD